MSSNPQPCLLGIAVTRQALRGVLLRDTPEGPQVLWRYHAARTGTQQAEASATPELVAEPDGAADFTLQIGEGGGGTDFLFASELADLGVSASGEAVVTPGGSTAFALELSSLLSACAAAGYSQPQVAFCVDASGIGMHQLRVPRDYQPPTAKKKLGSRKAEEADGPQQPDDVALADLLGRQLDRSVVVEQAAFVAMAPTEADFQRYLAVQANDPEPVAETIRQARKERQLTQPDARLLDTEVTLYVGLARVAAYLHTASQSLGAEAPAADDTISLCVRVGAEDTLVLFLQGEQVLHAEHVHGITTFDAPETLCSRVLLLQDEHDIAEVADIFVFSEAHEDELLASFADFFPQAHTASLRTYLPVPLTDEEADGEDVPPATHADVMATAVALRLLDDVLYQTLFPEVDLLPKKLHGSKTRLTMPVNGAAVALYALLLLTAGFFFLRYHALDDEITQRRDILEHRDASLATVLDPAVVRGRVDSLRQSYVGYMHALTVLDSLLRGSDRWSRTLAAITGGTDAVPGLWIEKWEPSATNLTLAGLATDRMQVVLLGERLNGIVESVAFSEVREWPVYAFRINVPLPGDLPEAARYLRDRLILDDTNLAQAAPLRAPPSG